MESPSPSGQTDRRALPGYGIIVQSSKARRGGAIRRRDIQKPSPCAIGAFGRDDIFGIAALDQLQEQDVPAGVDTRGPERDRGVAGYLLVITGEREPAIWPVAA